MIRQGTIPNATGRRFHSIKRIYLAACEIDPPQRAAFIRAEAEGDVDLQREVELLFDAAESGDGFLERMVVPGSLLRHATGLEPPWEDRALPPPLEPGDVLCDRFRIVRFLAAGGMGHVFEAHDSALDVRLALKVIRPEIAANVEAIARFRREVSLAREITHPNVCRIFDLERETGERHGGKRELYFATMELLEGETLATILARDGPLGTGEALDIARQLAGALDCAHARGVVHRDIKPGNVVLVPIGGPVGAPHGAGVPGRVRAVVTDFGLARLAPQAWQGPLAGEQAPISRLLVPVGTPLYMAPEQREGQPVSPATDIYAFGLVLFEMVTGRRTLQNGPSDGAFLRRANLPGTWNKAVSGCLEAQPEDRFQSAAEVVAVLEGHERMLPWSRRLWTARRRIRGVAGTRVMPWVLAALSLVALFAFALRYYKPEAPSGVASGATLYLAPIENRTGEAVFDQVTELMRAGLAQSPQFNLLDTSRAGDFLQQMSHIPDAAITPETARQVAMRAGASQVLLGALVRSRGGYALMLDLQQPDVTPARYRNHVSKTWTFPADAGTPSGIFPEHLLTTLRDASDWARKKAGEPVSEIAPLNGALEDVTTPNWQALSEYTRAERLHAARSDDEAVAALRNAVRLDPQFALAYGRLGDLLVTQKKMTDGYEAYSLALSNELERRLTRRERDRIQGMYAFDTRDMQAADIAFRDYVSFYRNDAAGWKYRVGALENLGRTDEALAALRKVLELRPNDEFGMVHLVDCLFIQGRFAESRQWMEKLRAAGYAARALELQGEEEFLTGKFEDAKRSFLALSRTGSEDVKWDGLPLAARVDAERGEYAEALKSTSAAVHELDEAGKPMLEAAALLDRATVRGKLGDDAGVALDVEQALGLNPSLQNALLGSSILGGALEEGTPVAKPALRREIARIGQWVSKQDRNQGVLSEVASLRVRGEIALAAGDWQGAVWTFRKAANLDYPAASREFLARALVAGAAHQSEPGKAARLRQEAEQAYAVIALREGYAWKDYLPDSPPGFYADELTGYLELAARRGSLTPALSRLAERLRLLRPKEFLSHPALSEASQGQTPTQ